MLENVAFNLKSRDPKGAVILLGVSFFNFVTEVLSLLFFTHTVCHCLVTCLGCFYIGILLFGNSVILLL